MDMLSKRYACPFSLLDDYIRLGQLHDSVKETIDIINEELKEETEWEFYLHKVWDKTFDEFLNGSQEMNVHSKQMTNDQIKNIVDDSANIIDLF